MNYKSAHKFLTNVATSAALCSLLLLYGIGSFPGDSLHVLVHAREVSELHSLESEKDACHQTLFHAEFAKGCEHKTHVANSHKCLFSQIAHQSLHISESLQNIVTISENSSYTEHIQPNVVVLFAGFFSSRAPPLV